MNQKPGVMVYFDMLPSIKTLTNANKGVLFEAILQYGYNRTIPKLPDKLLTVWPLVQMRLDRDEMQYMNVVTKRAYSAYVRWAKHNNQEVMDFTTWQEKKGYALINEAYEPSTGCFVRDV